MRRRSRTASKRARRPGLDAAAQLQGVEEGSASGLDAAAQPKGVEEGA
jgi:hypothetical protein